MKLPPFFKITGLIVILALLYIHVQMNIIDLSYQGKFKEEQIRNFNEENDNITYAILSLQSSPHLGSKMLADNSGMQFVAPGDILQISTSKKISNKESSSRLLESGKKTNSLLSLLSLGTQAPTKPEN